MDHNALRIERDRLALEAPLSLDLVGLFQNTFPSIRAGFSNLVQRFAATEPAVPLTSRQRDFLRLVEPKKYLELAPIVAYVPEGMESSYPHYLDAVLAAVEHAAHYSPKHLNQFALYLSQLVSQSDQHLASTSFEREHVASEEARKKLNAELGACFRVGSSRSESSYGAVVARNKDWYEVFEKNDAQAKLVNTVNRKDLDRKIAECVELMDILSVKLSRGDFQGISPQTITNIADGAYGAAQEMEFYAATHYRSMAISTAINRTMSHVFEVLKK